MATPFDAMLKELVQAYPADWLAHCGLATSGAIEVVEAELSTITAAADKVIRVGDEPAWLFHVELQASRDDSLLRRMLKYNVLLHDRHGLPEQSAVVLLRPAADPGLTGTYLYQSPSGQSRTEFRYQVVRIWQQPVQTLLASGFGTVPLAPLADVNEAVLPDVIAQMEKRLESVAPAQQASLWTATYILMGLRYTREFAAQLLKGIRAMKDSTTYQAILEEGETKGEIKGEIKGRIKEAHALLLRLGQKHLGPPPADILAAIQAISEVERLEQLVERVQELGSWQELLAG